ncbi:protease complex subunit PrcB family protein [Pontibacter sp. G13]|uniref:protease complex subunit PrcB family protein n=1 Tax=Pontibacter sp. G13 TaxID=3074898 RepID=UPI00288B13E9|nr:protease complex subunit PrcB family protein [Pontibacter sp. G13]WNJ15980.1 protease complex subunit PrcB family protein [Pontibacter sp. G13]
MNRLLLILSVGLTILVAACQGTKITQTEASSSGDTIPFEVLEKGSYSAIEQAGQYLIESEADWETWWKKIQANREPLPELPKIDFEQKTLVACFMGMRTNGGYSIEISDIRKDGNALNVQVIEREAGANCFVTEAITHPFVIVTIDKVSGAKASFNSTKEVTDC